MTIKVEASTDLDKCLVCKDKAVFLIKISPKNEIDSTIFLCQKCSSKLKGEIDRFVISENELKHKEWRKNIDKEKEKIKELSKNNIEKGYLPEIIINDKNRRMYCSKKVLDLLNEYLAKNKITKEIYDKNYNFFKDYKDCIIVVYGYNDTGIRFETNELIPFDKYYISSSCLCGQCSDYEKIIRFYREFKHEDIKYHIYSRKTFTFGDIEYNRNPRFIERKEVYKEMEIFGIENSIIEEIKNDISTNYLSLDCE